MMIDNTDYGSASEGKPKEETKETESVRQK